MAKVKKVSIIIVNWNGRHFLKMCLPSLAKITYPSYEVIVVDNGSTDGSVEFLKGVSFKKDTPYQSFRLIENRENLGFAEANNQAFRQARGEYVLLLNNDVEVEPDFLTILVKRLESDPKIACVQPKLCEYQDRSLLDSAGHFLTDTSFLYHYGRLKKASLPIYNRSMEIYSAKGAAMLLKKSVLEEMGFFDPDFFVYFEETDLCHRIWLAEYRIIYEPKAVVYHVVAGTSLKLLTSSRVLYFSLRNRICSFIKNYELVNLIRMLLILLAVYLGLALIYLLTFQFSLVWAIFRAIGWNIKNLPSTLKKRKFVQGKLRRVSDQELFKKLKKNPPLVYYFYLLRNRLGDFQDVKI